MMASSEFDFFFMTLELPRTPFEEVIVRAGSVASPESRQQIGTIQGEKALLSLLSAVGMTGYFVVSNERGQPPRPTFHPCEPEQLVGFLRRPDDQLNANIAKILADQPITDDERLKGRNRTTRVNIYAKRSFESGLRCANENLSGKPGTAAEV
jgi:hypothetical protein